MSDKLRTEDIRARIPADVEFVRRGDGRMYLRRGIQTVDLQVRDVSELTIDQFESRYLAPALWQLGLRK